MFVGMSGNNMMGVEDRGTEVIAPNKRKEVSETKVSNRQAGDEIEPSNYQAYPEAIASYQDVCGNKILFMESLEILHRAMRTKFMIPIIGGKDLDLHKLFLEVTSRGGLEKVIGDKKWREVTNTFNFPSSATNASFILRKYYISLLRHYEQIYFFRTKGWAKSSAVSPNITGASIFRRGKRIESEFSPPEIQSATRKRRRGNGEVALTAPFGQAFPPNSTVVGVIDGKFEDGYLITVTIGTNKLRGVLFNTSQQNAAQLAQPVSSAIDNNNGARVIRRRRRRKKISSWDPTHPKPNRSGYNFFFSEQHARLKPLHPGKDRDISRMIGELWNNLTEAERAVYQEIGMKDKERYQSEMAEYKEKQRRSPVLTDVIPLQQFPAEPSTEMQNMNLNETEDADIDVDEEKSNSRNEEKSEEGSEMQVSPEAGAAVAESDMAAAAESDMAAAVESDMAAAAEPSEFELRRRDLIETENENDAEMANEMANDSNVPATGDNVESEITAATASDKQMIESAQN